MEVENEKEQVGQRQIQNIQAEIYSTMKYSVEAKSWAQDDEKLKEKADAKWNKGNGILRARPHPVNPVTCERKRLRRFLDLHNDRKLMQMLFKEGPGSSTTKQKNLAEPLWPCGSELEQRRIQKRAVEFSCGG